MHDTIGFDLVGMVVDDLVVCGAEPLFLTDYIASAGSSPSGSPRSSRASPRRCVAGRLRAGRRRDRRAPRAARRPTSTTSPAPRPASSRPTRCSARTGSAPATCVIAMASSGLHSNGYSLVRHVLLDTGRLVARPPRRRARPHARRGAARADPDLRQGLPRRWPTRDRDPRDVPRHRRRPRRQPRAGAAGRARRPRSTASTWTPQPVFDLVRRVGRRRPATTSSATLNCGVGMVALTAPDDADRGDRACSPAHGIRAWVAGEVAAADGRRRRPGRAGRASTPAGDRARRRRRAKCAGRVCGNSHRSR